MDCWKDHPAPQYDRKHVFAERHSMALLVIDMQNHFSGISHKIVPNVVKTVRLCKDLGIPIFFTQHGHKDLKKDGGTLAEWWSEMIMYGSHDWEFQHEIQKLVDDQMADAIIAKNTYDAFCDTRLQEELDLRGVKTVAVCGVMTNLCCETTARSAFVKNYNVLFLGDATAARSHEMHRSSLINLAYGFARVVSTDQIASQLSKQRTIESKYNHRAESL